MTAAEFLERAGPLLLADEARHNLILGIAGSIRAAPESAPDARFWVVDGAAALRTPPFNLVLARPRDADALRALAALVDDDPPGVVGAVPEVHDFVRLYGRPARVVMEQGVYELTRVREPRAVPGEPREAARADLSLLTGWWDAFVDEAFPAEDTGSPRDAAVIERRLESPLGGFGLWVVDGTVVSMCGYGGPTPTGIRIGPVYTPRDLRGNGYATALTAHVSQRMLDSGRRFCFLYTDLANPTSNAIYERIGYRRVCESAQLAFEERGPR